MLDILSLSCVTDLETNKSTSWFTSFLKCHKSLQESIAPGKWCFCKGGHKPFLILGFGLFLDTWAVRFWGNF